MRLPDRLKALGAAGALLCAAVLLAPLESGTEPQLTPYYDVGGVRTWCYGETAGVPKAVYTTQECDKLLLQSVQRHWEGIKHVIPEDAPLGVHVAAISVTYNVGIRGFLYEQQAGRIVPSRLVQRLRARDWEGFCTAVGAPFQARHGVALGYKATVQGRPHRGLANRRAQEVQVCRRGL